MPVQTMLHQGVLTKLHSTHILQAGVQHGENPQKLLPLKTLTTRASNLNFRSLDLSRLAMDHPIYRSPDFPISVISVISGELLVVGLRYGVSPWWVPTKSGTIPFL